MFKRDCDIFTFFTLLFHIIKGGGGGVHSNEHLNISHPMHRGGGGLTSIDPTKQTILQPSPAFILTTS